MSDDAGGEAGECADGADGAGLGESSLKRRRERVALASRESRAKKKHELESLREANGKLKEERELFVAKIRQLEDQVENRIPSSTVSAIAENNALRLEIELYRGFVESFVKLASGPDSLSGQRALLREGAEAAQAYVLGLMAESQHEWKRLRFPLPVKVGEFGLHYCIKDHLFGRVDEQAKTRRLQLRIDVAFPGVRAKDVAEYYWQLFRSKEEQERCIGFSSLELQEVDSPDDDTHLVYTRKRRLPRTLAAAAAPAPAPAPAPAAPPAALKPPAEYTTMDQDVVFLCHRERVEMPRSSLRPPHVQERTAAEINDGGDPWCGKTSVISVALASARSTHEVMRSYAMAHGHGKSGSPASPDGGAEDDDSGTQHIKSVISQGALCWDDAATNAGRLSCVLSYPEEYRWLDLSFEECVNEETDEVTDAFARVLVGITDRLHEVFYA